MHQHHPPPLYTAEIVILSAVNRRHSWAMVLAGSDETRLQGLTQLICGDQRPKQLRPIFGGKRLLAHTLERLGAMFSQDHTVCVLARDHEQFYRPELSDKDHCRSIVQLMSRKMGVTIAVALLRIVGFDPDVIMAFCPSDHCHAEKSRVCLRSQLCVSHGICIALVSRPR